MTSFETVFHTNLVVNKVSFWTKIKMLGVGSSDNQLKKYQTHFVDITVAYNTSSFCILQIRWRFAKKTGQKSILVSMGKNL
jgi:hypothetical protein